jgi:hypothetical protein
VIVAVVAVRMMQVSSDEVVDMVSVRHGFVATTGAMLVGRIVGTTSMGRRARGRVRCANRERVLVDSIDLRVVQMAVVEVVSVPVVLHGSMAAAGAVLVCVIGVSLVIRHERSPFADWRAANGVRQGTRAADAWARAMNSSPQRGCGAQLGMSCRRKANGTARGGRSDAYPALPTTGDARNRSSSVRDAVARRSLVPWATYGRKLARDPDAWVRLRVDAL